MLSQSTAGFSHLCYLPGPLRSEVRVVQTLLSAPPVPYSLLIRFFFFLSKCKPRSHFFQLISYFPILLNRSLLLIFSSHCNSKHHTQVRHSEVKLASYCSFFVVVCLFLILAGKRPHYILYPPFGRTNSD